MQKSIIADTWVISDGTKGMENQSLALAKLLDTNFRLIRYNPPYFLKKFPSLKSFYISCIKKYFLTEKNLPSYVITTGKRMAGVSMALKSILKDKVKTIHVQNPKLPFKYFDLLLIPEHDNVTAENVIQTKGALSFFNFNDLNNFKDNKIRTIKKNKKSLILLMIGGNNKRYEPNNTDYYNLSIKIIQATKNINGQLIILPSRRTSSKALKILNSTFLKHYEHFQIINSSNQNPYPNILRIADYIVVTSDSVNMISETATLPTPLFVSHFSKETGKVCIFIQNLEKLGVLKKFEGELFHYCKKRLNTNEETILKIHKFFGTQTIT